MEPLRLRRIKNSMIHAAKKGEVYHLWWHPHNFGKNTDENLQFLTEILELAVTLRNDYGFKSLNMGEASSYVLGMNEERVGHLEQGKISIQH